MESAIPAHLRTARTRDARTPKDYQPPYPSFVARHAQGVKRVVMAYFGMQYRDAMTIAARNALDGLAVSFAAKNGPTHWDRAQYVDQARFTNVVSVAYWDNPKVFDAWFETARDGWTGAARAKDDAGFFIEVLRPAVESYETLFSSLGRPEGIAVLADGMSGEVQEHAYWGGMRDRIPLSQNDGLAPGDRPRIVRHGSRLQVMPQDYICMIRSGQDWIDTDDAERQMYLNDVEPVLRAGMDFLRDDGRAIGCFTNRYMRVLDGQGNATEKSYGQSWWHSIAALEQWAESHPTHLRIFGAAMKYLSTLGPAAKLRLYHEVSVARADEQFFEYLNCHARTGLLNAVEPVA